LIVAPAITVPVDTRYRDSVSRFVAAYE